MKTMTMYHPNGKGTGSAMKLELHPAHDDVDGSMFVTLAPQKTASAYTEDEHGGMIRTFPSFDWGNAVTVKLDILDLTQVLMVLRGVEEAIADGKGLFHRTKKGNIVIKFEHRIEPVPGYWFEIAEKPTDGDIRRLSFFMRQTEAFALCSVIEQSLLYIAFGVPTREA